MNILFIHQNFAGQYRQLAPSLLQRGHNVLAISMRKEEQILGIPNVGYMPQRSSCKDIHPWLTNTETAVIRAEAVARVLIHLQLKGYKPDIILGHSGWGETLLIKELLPHIPLINFSEYYYRARGADVGFDLELEPSDPNVILTRNLGLPMRNLHLTQSLLNCDVAVVPTKFQASLHPAALVSKLRVIHDGINTDKLIPATNHTCSLTVEGKLFQFAQGQEIVTFIARSLEPMRGYHRFLRALPAIMAARPNAHVVIVGGEGVSYGATPQSGGYKQRFFDEVAADIDVSRVHFAGTLPYDKLIDLLKVSMVHVYLTYPFVLSWSMLEAMSLGAVVVGSATAPVQEVITHGENGLLVDFFDTPALAKQVIEVLSKPSAFTEMRKKARQTVVDHYDYQTICLPQHLALIEQLSGQKV